MLRPRSAPSLDSMRFLTIPGIALFLTLARVAVAGAVEFDLGPLPAYTPQVPNVHGVIRINDT